jgi:2-polyprenyl-3-methyl-5-hydroxy-6-metoxy-1,4-benzoquinol methylase
MSFYSDFAGHYETIFPLDEAAYSFLRSRLPPAGGRVLDVGCGTGDYCGRLASDGYEALGVDLDREMIDVAARRFPDARFSVLGMADLASLGGRHDAIFCIGNVLAHLPRGDLARFLLDVRGVLEPSAPWIFQTVNWDFILERESFRFPDIAAGGAVFRREYPKVSREHVRFVTRLEVEGSPAFEGEVVLYPMRAADYLGEHAAAGFELEAHYGDFHEGDFDPGRQSSSVFVLRRVGER